MQNYTLEVCVDTLESALAAERGGATRLELCGDLIIGGVTPHPLLWQQIRQQSAIEMRVMIRPRFGDFCYSDSEFEIMKNSLLQFKELGAEGVVFGILLPDGQLDYARMSILCELAGNMKVTLHRAFDVCQNPFEALKAAKQLGIDTILTSGQQPTALKGKQLLANLQQQSGGIEILAGASVSPDNIAELHADTGITNYHLSGKKVVESPMQFRRPEINMGLPGLCEFDRWSCDETIIFKAKQLLEKL